MTGSQVELDGVRKKGRKMVYTTSFAEVPEFCIITPKAYGAGIYAMAGPVFGTDAMLALTNAEIAVMGPDAIVRAMYSEEIGDIEDPDEGQGFIEEQKAHYEKDVRKQAARMQVDELIAADGLREQLIERLETYKHKPHDDPDRVHGSSCSESTRWETLIPPSPDSPVMQYRTHPRHRGTRRTHR
jgi:acetyl-CoA carboxylase carboxyltransferase component